jgi:predicted metal-dependent phosphoesterase TrpH
MSEMSQQQPAPFAVDLQMHSIASDGTDTPAALLQLCADRGLRVVAVTDHDSVLGVHEATLAGRAVGIWVIPAIEFSTRSELDRDYADINILAYGIDPNHPQLQGVLQQVIDSRIEQKIQQIERLQSYGVDVPVAEVLASAKGVPGRMHIARVALERNPQRFSTLQDVFVQYLGADAPDSTYVTRGFSLRVEDAIEITHMAGGIAVLAHPGIYTRVRNVEDAVRRMRQAGLDGLEICYTYAQNRGHFGESAEEVAALIQRFDALADQFGLLKTGGSDYHGTAKPGILPGQAGLTSDAWEALAATVGWERPQWLT